MADLVDQLVDDLRRHRMELDRLVEERERVIAALGALEDAGLGREKPGVRSARQRGTEPLARASGPRAERAPRGHNRGVILDIVRERPGASVTEVVNAAVKVGVASKATAYTTVSTLVKSGAVQKSGQGGLTLSLE